MKENMFSIFSINDLISDLLLVDEYLRGRIVNKTVTEDADAATVANQTSSIFRNTTTRACSLLTESEVDFLNFEIDTLRKLLVQPSFIVDTILKEGHYSQLLSDRSTHCC